MGWVTGEDKTKFTLNEVVLALYIIIIKYIISYVDFTNSIIHIVNFDNHVLVL